MHSFLTGFFTEPNETPPPSKSHSFRGGKSLQFMEISGISFAIHGNQWDFFSCPVGATWLNRATRCLSPALASPGRVRAAASASLQKFPLEGTTRLCLRWGRGRASEKRLLWFAAAERIFHGKVAVSKLSAKRKSRV